MLLEKIKQLLKNGVPSVVVFENEKPAYVIMEYSFFENIVPAKTEMNEKNSKDELTKNLILEDIEDENVDYVQGGEGVKLCLSDLPV